MKGLINRILLGLVVLLLGANLIVIRTSGESMMEAETFEWTVFAVASLIALGFTGFGLRVATRARRNRDKSSFVWARRGFVAALAVVLAIIGDTVTPGESAFFPESIRIRAAIAIALVGVAPAFFAVAVHREYLRTRSSSSHGESRRSRSA